MEQWLLESNQVPGGILIYYADGDREILHVNQYVLDLFECDTMEEFMQLTGGSFNGFVYAHELEAITDSIWGQVKEDDGHTHIFYQVCTKSGTAVGVDGYGKLVRRESERPVFYVFLVKMNRGDVIDWLTGLSSMDRFHHVAELAARESIARGTNLALVDFDIMGTKHYNARYGRKAGDQMLRTFADILRKHFPSNVCSRFGGDSFCTITAADVVEDRVKSAFADFLSCGIEGAPPIKAGIYSIEKDDDIAHAVDRAQLACESNSATWESHYMWYTDEMRCEAALRIHILDNLDRALAEGWVRPYYQGIVRSATGRVCHEEALARWIDPEYGPLSPASFIPVLEEAGLLSKLDLHIVDHALADMADRRQRGVGVVPISVNLSLRDLDEMDIANAIARMADARGIEHKLLRIEFTESVASSNPQLLHGQIDALHKEGFEVWMDDFGSGFSSLAAIKEFDFDLIKLDMAFFKKKNDEKCDIIVDSIIRAAKRLGTKTLAEGIETAEQAERLASMGCDMLQGYHYFRPTPLKEIISTLRAGTHLPLEPQEEEPYWDAVASVSLCDLASNNNGQGVSESPVSELPAGIIELRDDSWYVPRANEALRDFLDRGDVLSTSIPTTQTARFAVRFDEALHSAIVRCRTSGSWERISGPVDTGSGYQFYAMPLVSCETAEAFLIMSMPTLLGAGLGTYGDVPVAYAVLRVILNEAGDGPQDVEYVYANDLYREWGRLGPADFTGKTLLEVAGFAGLPWLSLCYRSAIEGESLHDVTYSSHAGHWISYNFTPSRTEGCCIFAFSLADAEQSEREQLILAGTHDPLTNLLNRRGIDEAIAENMKGVPDKPFVLILMDVDDFKTVNDLYGHDVGDEALRTLAHELVATFPPTAIIGRNGGDEVLVALFGKDVDNLEEMLKYLTSRSLTFELHDQRYLLPLSAGYAWYKPNLDLQTVYTRADEALYAVKLEGKSGFRAWTPELADSPLRSLLGFTSRELAEGIPLAMLAHRPSGKILFANDGLAHLLGYEELSDALLHIASHMQGMVHPEDWPRVSQQLMEVERLTASNALEIAFRVLAKGDEVKRVVYRARVVNSKGKGDIVYAYIVSTDALLRNDTNA